MKQTTIEVREIIINNFKNGKSYRQISEIVNRSVSTIQDIIKRYVKENRLENKARKANNKIFNQHDERWILRKIKENPMLSAPKLSVIVKKYLEKEVCSETIRRVLRKNGFHGRIARNKPFINERNRKKRLEFAKKYINKDFDFWKDVVFTDESKFNIFKSDGKVNVWRRAGEEYNIQNLQATVKHGGGSVMVWGCVTAGGVGNWEFIETKMDKWGYLNILKKNLQSSVQKLGISDTFKFYADNDPKHSSRVCQEWLLYNTPKVIQTPPQSPDFNVIEHVWHILDSKIREHQISNKNELKKVLEEEWKKIDVNYLETLVKSMPKRLQSAIRQKGYSTKY